MRTLLLVVTAALITAPMAANAQGGPRDRATGGGQILVSTDGGAGDTIAFTAQNTGTDDVARGEVQYIDRTGGTGQGQTRFHGDVTCMTVMGNTAKIAGTFKNGSNDTSTGFVLFVTDNGQGNASGADQIAFQRTTDPTCERDNSDDDGNTDLARGNAQVHDAP
jgi:hypothetical protein